MSFNPRYLLVLFLIVISLDNIAQTRYLIKTVDVNIPTVLDLQITAGGNPIVDFNTTGKIDNGIELPAVTSLIYRSNKAFFITIKAANANFSGGLAGSPMPASVIGFRLNGTGNSYTKLSAMAQPLIASSSSMMPRGKNSFILDYKIDPGYIYPPAQDYTLQIIYTISNL